MASANLVPREISWTLKSIKVLIDEHQGTVDDLMSKADSVW